MTELLVKCFVKDYKNIKSAKVRTAYGMLTSIVSMICNVLLSAAKITVGLLANSVSVVADGLNNMSDAFSSVIGLVGIKLAERPADEDHPFGHGRYEYIAALVVAFLVFEVAINCFKSSIEKIFNPEKLEFSWISIGVLVLSVLVKMWMMFFNKKLGKRTESTVMLAVAADAKGDMLITSANIVALLIFFFFDINIDGYMGCIVSVAVFMAGIGIARETIEPLLGQRAGEDVYKLITEAVEAFDGIEGTHDLIVHKYGHCKTMATIHAEIRNDMDIEVAHELIDLVEREVLANYDIFIVIHMDPVDINDENVNRMKHEIQAVVAEIEPKASIHDFRVVNGAECINLIFDLVAPFSYNEAARVKLVKQVEDEAMKVDKRYRCVITVENSYV